MKVTALAILITLISCASPQNKMTKKSIWSLDNEIKNPESVYIDPISKFTFVSNINGAGDAKDGNGYITLLGPTGKLIKSKWVDGLNAPKGMRSYKNVLWVSDIDQVHAIDINTSTKIGSFKVEGANFLNDIAVAKNGDVYISDTIASKIYTISKGKVTTYLEGDDLESPNGLLIKGDSLYIASWGLTTDWSTKTPGSLYSINLKTRERTNITSPLGNLDGLEMDQKGNFIISDWMNGKIHRVSKEGKTELIHQGVKGDADIALKGNQIYIPSMLQNKIYKVSL